MSVTVIRRYRAALLLKRLSQNSLKKPGAHGVAGLQHLRVRQVDAGIEGGDHAGKKDTAGRGVQAIADHNAQGVR